MRYRAYEEFLAGDTAGVNARRFARRYAEHPAHAEAVCALLDMATGAGCGDPGHMWASTEDDMGGTCRSMLHVSWGHLAVSPWALDALVGPGIAELKLYRYSDAPKIMPTLLVEWRGETRSIASSRDVASIVRVFACVAPGTCRGRPIEMSARCAPPGDGEC